MEKWRNVWRRGIAPQLPLAGLRALLTALVEDSPELIQGQCCFPNPATRDPNQLVQSACAICYEGVTSDCTIGEMYDFFHEVCRATDDLFDEPCMSRFFINWFDDTPREIMRRELIPEVELAIKAQEAKGGA